MFTCRHIALPAVAVASSSGQNPSDNKDRMSPLRKADAEARKLHLKMISLKTDAENRRADSIREIAVKMDAIAKTETEAVKKALSKKHKNKNDFHVPEIVVGIDEEDDDEEL